MSKKHFVYVIVTFILCGCSGTGRVHEGPAPGPVTPMAASQAPAPAEKPEPEPIPSGMVFAKTELTGVVETDSTRLMFVPQADSKRVYHLFVGEKGPQKDLEGTVYRVGRGYFLLELPSGPYRIRSVAIPVGTSVAAENMDVVFDVPENRVAYAGTLRITGTKERIKLGGVPVIKPGFDYTVDVIDEYPQAVLEFKQRFPQLPDKLIPSLFQVNVPAAPEEEDPGAEAK